ncbi:SDR family oxidoreductase [Pseudoxanthomonas sangjuensis]|uniref:SDR family oxidoreductase n=1 Tax=Pseudoxanthomonas sangjuensis TaxID=1503750 RepID=UPI001391426B|nr:SDR family oxidoreductase [Pseudoxanthomonas sangjuensis]KAF1707126.1 epimerase [Pseudoxanthomonas sangjuensis]
MGEAAAKGTVLVVGAGGFLGGYIVAALREAGWRVLRGMRARGAAAADVRHCDLSTMLAPQQWSPALDGVDAVVNVAGILREAGTQRFDPIHHDAPLALARACVAKGVRRFVQVSALGAPEDGGFIASKHRFDQALLRLPLDAVVLRPSIVYATSGSYGGTSLLRALAALPFATLLPGDGRWPIQPVVAEDLARVAAHALDAPAKGLHEVGGPEPMSLREYQLAWREWLRIPGRRAWPTSEAWVSMLVWCWERIGSGPVGETMWRMLRRGNVAAPGASEDLRRHFGFAPRALREVLAAQPSQAQDRWQAQLYFLAPALRFAFVLLWLLSAGAGFATPAAQVDALAAGSPLEGAAPVALARGGAAIDLLLAAWLLSGWRLRTAVGLMAVSVLAYTLVLGVALPATWLDPLGGLAKNLVVLPALAVLWVLSDRR